MYVYTYVLSNVIFFLLEEDTDRKKDRKTIAENWYALFFSDVQKEK